MVWFRVQPRPLNRTNGPVQGSGKKVKEPNQTKPYHHCIWKLGRCSEAFKDTLNTSEHFEHLARSQTLLNHPIWVTHVSLAHIRLQALTLLLDMDVTSYYLDILLFVKLRGAATAVSLSPSLLAAAIVVRVRVVQSGRCCHRWAVWFREATAGSPLVVIIEGARSRGQHRCGGLVLVQSLCCGPSPPPPLLSPSLGRCGRVMGDPIAEHGWDQWCPPSCITASVVVIIGVWAVRDVAIGTHFVVVVGGGERKKGQPGARVNRKGNVPFALKLSTMLDDTSPVSSWTNAVGSHRHTTWGGGEIESLVEAPRHHRPPPTPRFTDGGQDGGVFLSHPEYGSNDIMFEAGQDQDLRRSFHLTQLKRSSLHLEKCWVKQKIEEHEITLQALKERMTDIEESIASTTSKVHRCSICMTPDTAELRHIFQRHYAAYITMRDELFTKCRFTFAAAHLPIPPDSDHPEYQV
ncbi:hypothetical protein EDB89DRAFT_1909079 [Lactarius sanguifluus]|nr:hypothetical protein EDB89DRAFT_1909079 [Lactarius sanguifluus]